MPQEQKPIRLVLIDYLCDRCGIGHMHTRGFFRLDKPPPYTHFCDHCKEPMTFLEKYPAVRYIVDGESIEIAKYPIRTS